MADAFRTTPRLRDATEEVCRDERRSLVPAVIVVASVLDPPVDVVGVIVLRQVAVQCRSIVTPLEWVGLLVTYSPFLSRCVLTRALPVGRREEAQVPTILACVLL